MKEMPQPSRAAPALSQTATALLEHPGFYGRMRDQARLLVDAYEANPRIGSVFATQQRWLMAHLALSMYFRGVSAGGAGSFSAARFFEAVEAHRVASRNTADAFLKEMVRYDYARHVAGGADRRIRPLEPAPLSVESIRGWLIVHLATLDGLDGGDRVQAFAATPGAAARLQPAVAGGLLSSRRIREPSGTFSLFTWLDNGGNIMDWMIAGIEDAPPGTERIPTGFVSIVAMADWLKLSRTHLARKLADAEKLGSLGWLGRRGRSAMWVSDGFRQEYAAAQAAKLAIISDAFDATLRTPALDQAKRPARPPVAVSGEAAIA